MFGKASELCFDKVDYVFLFRIMFSNLLNYILGIQIMFSIFNYVRKASELCFEENLLSFESRKICFHSKANFSSS